MRHDQEHLNITVEDNGKGFNFDEMKTKNSAGLQNIQSRVNYLNGKMDIQSVIGKGTSVYIECDLNQNGYINE
jgi:Signal transduction histidine kinase